MSNKNIDLLPPRKPDYILKAKRGGKTSGRLGAAWKNPSGNISIILDVCTCLVESENLQVTLFPNDRE
jgi:hypothetical protein